MSLVGSPSISYAPTLKNIATPARRSSQSSVACPQETCFGPTPEPMRSTKADRCAGDRSASDAGQECAGSTALVPGETASPFHDLHLHAIHYWVLGGAGEA